MQLYVRLYLLLSLYERVKGVEPSSSVWKTEALTVELHPRCDSQIVPLADKT